VITLLLHKAIHLSCFFQYCWESCSIRQEKIGFSLFTKDFVMGFCDWIESERNCSTTTRNLRLTALHSFFRYVQSKSPAYAYLCSDILGIPMKKSPKKPPEHLMDIEIKMLLAEPDVIPREESVILPCWRCFMTQEPEPVN
jgi:integrase/recombinase XerD